MKITVHPFSVLITTTCCHFAQCPLRKSKGITPAVHLNAAEQGGALHLCRLMKAQHTHTAALRLTTTAGNHILAAAAALPTPTLICMCQGEVTNSTY